MDIQKVLKFRLKLVFTKKTDLERFLKIVVHKVVNHFWNLKYKARCHMYYLDRIKIVTIFFFAQNSSVL